MVGISRPTVSTLLGLGSKRISDQGGATVSTGALTSIKDQDVAGVSSIERVSISSNVSAPAGFNGYRRSTNLNTLSTASYTRGVMHQQAATQVGSEHCSTHNINLHVCVERPNLACMHAVTWQQQGAVDNLEQFGTPAKPAATAEAAGSGKAHDGSCSNSRYVSAAMWHEAPSAAASISARRASQP